MMQAESRAALERRATLALYLDQLAQARAANEDLNAAIAGADLDGWELSQLDEALSGATQAWQALIVEGIAFQIKLQTDLGFASPTTALSAEDEAEIRDLLLGDAAIGIALLEETQRAINDLVLSGEMELATRLTGFRNKLGQRVTRLRGQVDEQDFAQATARSEIYCEPKEDAEWQSSEFRPKTFATEGPTPPPKPLSQVRMVERRNTGSSQRPIKGWLMVLGASICLWAVLILPRMMNNQPLPELSVSDVAPRQEIRHVISKPPSLYVELDSAAWRAMSKTGRLELIDDVGQTAMAAGYNGAQFTLEGGEAVGRWLKARGSELAD